MHERLPYSNKRHGPTEGLSPTDRKKPRHHHSSKKKGMAGATKHRRAVGVGVVTELTSGGHAQAAGAYYAAGNSCEQAVFAAYAGEMGLSVVKAQQEAPRRKDRGALCGAYTAGKAVLERLILTTPPVRVIKQDDGMCSSSMEASEGGDEKTVDDAKTVDDMHAVMDDFMRLFLTEFGSIDCLPIEEGRKDCLGVITMTARIIEQVIDKYGLR